MLMTMFRSKEMKDVGIFVFWMVVIVLLIIFGPLLSIWALNTLFPALAIPYTFWTWLAMVLFNAAFVSRYTRKD